MSVHARAARKQSTPSIQPTRADWLTFLRDQLDETWRPGEWHPEHWCFLGDPTDPRTRIYTCKSKGCPLFTDTRGGPCQSCRAVLRKNGGDQEALERKLAKRHKDAVRTGAPQAQCLVERGDLRCERSVISHGLCGAHNTLWLDSYEPRGITRVAYLEAKIAKPLPAIGPCLVGACERERHSQRTLLCGTHRNRYVKTLEQLAPGAQRPSEAEAATTMPPVLSLADFSLISMPEQLRLEFLVAIQAEDRAGYALDPMVIKASVTSLTAAGPSFLSEGFLSRLMSNARPARSIRTAFQNRAVTAIRNLHAAFDGGDPTAGDLWDSYLVGLKTENERSGRADERNGTKYLVQRGPLDFTPIRQQWLRELVKAWARETTPTTQAVGCAIRAFAVMSDVLSMRQGGDDASTAGARDIQKTVERLNRLAKSDGEPYSGVTRSKYLTAIRRALHYLHGTEHLGSVSPRFVVTPEHRINGRAAMRTEDSGRALPNRVVDALHRGIGSLPAGRAQAGSLISAETLLMMHQTALRVLIDTGRRPNEVCSLSAGCVTAHPSGHDNPGGVEYTLTYDNTKAGRLGRVLPIGVDTAMAIRKWDKHRRSLGLPESYARWLFPSPSVGRADAGQHLTTSGLDRALDRLVASVPGLETDIPDRTSGGYVQFEGPIIAYSFRHSYAQRHADSGVPLDTLQELMDHLSPETTAVYYRVSAKRKREAVNKLAASAIDHHGNPAPFASGAAYEIAQVPVPFGGCTDPANVKAGGGACPIRFQCAGCSLYRPDPSYLPAIEEHLVSLRGTLLMVEIAGTAAPWVLQHQRDEIASFEQILAGLKQRVASMDDTAREALADASVAMRRLRASRPLIPLTVRTPDAT